MATPASCRSQAKFKEQVDPRRSGSAVLRAAPNLLLRPPGSAGRELLLHVGTHKTGTTSLQVTLADLSADLAARGILYPETGRVGAGHHNIAWGLVGDRRFDRGVGYLDELADEIRRQGAPR